MYPNPYSGHSLMIDIVKQIEDVSLKLNTKETCFCYAAFGTLNEPEKV